MNTVPGVDVLIVNRKGLHARASAKFVKCAEAFNAQIRVTREGQTVGGTSIMGLMMLAAGNGSVISVTADGPDEAAAIESLGDLIGRKFEEA